MRSGSGATVRVLLIAVGAALVVAGCGGTGESDENGVRAAIVGYFDGFADGDGEAACAHVTGNAKIELVELAASAGIDSVSCATIVEELSGLIGASEVDRLRDLTVTNIEIDGARATATIQGATVRPTLTESDGAWYIDSGFTG